MRWRFTWFRNNLVGLKYDVVVVVVPFGVAHYNTIHNSETAPCKWAKVYFIVQWILSLLFCFVILIFFFLGPLCGAGVCVKKKKNNTSNDMSVITHCWVALCDAMRTNPFLQLSRPRRLIIVARYVQMPYDVRVCTLIFQTIYCLPTRQVWVHTHNPIKRMILFFTEIKKIIRTTTTTKWSPHANRHTFIRLSLIQLIYIFRYANHAHKQNPKKEKKKNSNETRNEIYIIFVIHLIFLDEVVLRWWQLDRQYSFTSFAPKSATLI